MDYWNHNTAYHPMLVEVAAVVHGDVLDVGCGDGLLVERLAAVSRRVVGIDRDGSTIRRAEVRTAALANARVHQAEFLAMDVVPETYDLVTFAAVLHHLDLEAALRRSRLLLRPGGRLVVVGLSADRSVGDHARAAALLPAVRLMSWIHREDRRVEVVARAPTDTLSEIATTAAREMPGARLRRAFYYRYVMEWTKPATDRAGGGRT